MDGRPKRARGMIANLGRKEMPQFDKTNKADMYSLMYWWCGGNGTFKDVQQK